MRRFIFTATMSGVLCLAAVTDAKNLTSAEVHASWKSLFDGETLVGWKGTKSSRPDSSWQAGGGELKTSGSGADLVSVDEFGDFELALEWKVEKGANSGIFYRAAPGPNSYETAPEYQIL